MKLLTDIIYKGAEHYGERKALAVKPKYRTVVWTYSDLLGFSNRINSMLKERGVVRGDRVVLWASNSPYWLGIFFGCLMRGVIVVPLHTENTPDFIKKVSDQTQPKLFFKSSDLHEVAGIEWIDIDYLDDLQSPKELDKVELNEDDTAEILYTSGTTGEPKGVILTHKNIASNIRSVWDIISIKKEDRVLSILPMSHIFEQAVEFRVLAAGSFIVYSPALSSSLIRKTLREYKINKMAAVPEFLKRIIARIELQAKDKKIAPILSFLFSASRLLPQRHLRRFLFSSIHGQFGGKLDLVVSGGAALDEDTAKKWQLLGVRIIQGYGLTETSPVLSVLSPGDNRIKSVGKAVEGVEIKIADDGEILAKGLNITQGYWKAPEKTKEAFTDDGWFRTGDLGYLDERGYLYIRGRKKFMILTSSGQNVYPEDIEAELNKEKEIEDSAVVGLEKQGKIFIHAALLGDIKDKDAEKIITRANSRLASFQQIQSWSVWPFEDFPRTTTRKVKRQEVADYIKSRQAPSQMRKKEEGVSDVFKIVGEVTGRRGFKKDDRIVSLGLDSLARIELVGRIEEELGIEIDEASITQQTTIEDLEKILREKPKTKTHYVLRSWPRYLIVKSIREFLYWFLITPVFGFFMNMKVDGADNIKGLKTPAIFMPNHISDLDTPAMFLALPGHIRRKLALATATDVLFETFWYIQPLVALLFNIYPFPRRGQTRKGFEHTGELIDEDWSILVFPEGRIVEPGKKITLKEGTGVAAVEMGIPVVPVKIEGADKIMPLGRHLPIRRGEVVVRFGEVLYFDKKTEYEKATRIIQDSLRKL